MSEIKLRVPRVYGAIHALASELASSGIAKSQVNKNEGYRYRGIDDVMEVLAPLLAQHRLCVLPRVLERSVEQRSGERRSLLVSVCLKVAFDIVSVRDGSMHTIETCGEAIDGGDKATAKAMSAAWKQAMLQAFCIPAGLPDSDAENHLLEDEGPIDADPVMGWEQWSQDICKLIAGCSTDEAISRVQTTYRDQLRTLSRRRSDLFAAIGAANAQRRCELSIATDRFAIDTKDTAAITSLNDAVTGRWRTEEVSHA
jgi:hypothetical protein